MGREPWSEPRTRQIVIEHMGLEGPLMPILHACVETFGFVPQEAVPVIANELNLSRAEVHGVVTFYHDFRREPAGKHVLKMCRAEACQSMGCEPLVKQAEDRLGIKCGETSADGRVTLEPIYCLGLCATAPSAMLDGKIVGRLNEAKLDKLLKGAGA
jgi:formate dehydrogenase subunit gamma